MSMSLFRSLFLLSFLIAGAAFAEEKPEEKPEEEKGEPKKEEKDWLEFYYESPTPDRFVEEMKNWAEDGTLQNHKAQAALIGFISQLMRANRDKIKTWHGELAGLDPKDQIVLRAGLLFSRTGEADEILAKSIGKRQLPESERPPKILELALDKLATINLLWGFYYATGSDKPIRRILLCFRFEEAPEFPEDVEIPKGYRPYYKELPRMAYISMAANLKRHPKLVEICEKIYAEDKTLRQSEKTGLHDLLSEVNPEKYPPRPPVESEE